MGTLRPKYHGALGFMVPQKSVKGSFKGGSIYLGSYGFP